MSSSPGLQTVFLEDQGSLEGGKEDSHQEAGGQEGGQRGRETGGQQGQGGHQPVGQQRGPGRVLFTTRNIRERPLSRRCGNGLFRPDALLAILAPGLYSTPAPGLSSSSPVKLSSSPVLLFLSPVPLFSSVFLSFSSPVLLSSLGKPYL